MKRPLFQHTVNDGKSALQENPVPLEKLVDIQAQILVQEYGATCFDVKQVQKILSVGESNVYQLLRSGKLASRTIGRRKIVPAVTLAQFLVAGD